MSFQEFINMGGFGFYIWTSYAIALVIFVGLIVALKLQRNKIIKQIRRQCRQNVRQQTRPPSQNQLPAKSTIESES